MHCPREPPTQVSHIVGPVFRSFSPLCLQCPDGTFPKLHTTQLLPPRSALPLSPLRDARPQLQVHTQVLVSPDGADAMTRHGMRSLLGPTRTTSRVSYFTKHCISLPRVLSPRSARPGLRDGARGLTIRTGETGELPTPGRRQCRYRLFVPYPSLERRAKKKPASLLAVRLGSCNCRQ